MRKIDPKEARELEKITQNVRMVRERKLMTINHPMDRLDGVNQTSIQKIPFDIKLAEYNLGLVINSYILKICRLDIKKHSSSIIDMIQKFISLGRGMNRLEQGNSKIKTEFIIGEIFLNLIRFINTNLDTPERFKMINGINLMAVMTFYLKPTQDIAFYCIYLFHKLIYPQISESTKDHSITLVHQSELIMGNLIDYLRTEKFIPASKMDKLYLLNKGDLLIDLYECS